MFSLLLKDLISDFYLYVFIRNRVESFVIYEPCHGESLSVLVCRMGESGLMIRLAHAQCLVITEDGEQGFSKTGPIF